MAVSYPERGTPILPLTQFDRHAGPRTVLSSEETMLNAFESSLGRLKAAVSTETPQYHRKEELDLLRMSLSFQLRQAKNLGFYPVGTPEAMRLLGMRKPS